MTLPLRFLSKKHLIRRKLSGWHTDSDCFFTLSDRDRNRCADIGCVRVIIKMGAGFAVNEFCYFDPGDNGTVTLLKDIALCPAR